jgi:hypothetical protein
MAAKQYADDDVAVPANDAWTGMLAISLLALVIGCVLLFLDWSRHSEKPTSFTLPPVIDAKLDSDDPVDPVGGDDKKGAADKKGPGKGAEQN